MKPIVTIYVVAYNEETIIEFFINHYRKRFPNCIIHLYDNYSTDRTVEIAESMGCIIHKYRTDGFDDSANLDIKSTQWKSATTEWVIVCDCDELLDITQEELIMESNNGYDVIEFEGYTLMNKETNEIDLNNLKYGFRDEPYDKYYLFNKDRIIDIGYTYGCHSRNGSRPISITGYANIGSSKKYKALHYKYISKEYCINRRKIYGSRLSSFNELRGFVTYCKKTDEELQADPIFNIISIENLFNNTELIKVLD